MNAYRKRLQEERASYAAQRLAEVQFSQELYDMIIGAAKESLKGKEHRTQRPYFTFTLADMNEQDRAALSCVVQPSIDESPEGWIVSGKIKLEMRAKVKGVRKPKLTAWVMPDLSITLGAHRTKSGTFNNFVDTMAALITALSERPLRLLTMRGANKCGVCGLPLVGDRSQALGIGPEFIKRVLQQYSFLNEGGTINELEVEMQQLHNENRQAHLESDAVTELREEIAALNVACERGGIKGRTV